MGEEIDISEVFLSQIGQNISKYRKKKKLSLEALGLEMGLTRMQVHRIEKGYNITMTTLLKLSIALNILPSDLLKINFKLKKADLEKLVDNSKSGKIKSPKK